LVFLPILEKRRKKMKKIIVLFMSLFFLFLPVPGFSSDFGQYVNFEVGIEAGWSTLNIGKGIPPAARQEAKDPWIFDPRSQEIIGKAAIGSFSPGNRSEILEYRTFLRLYFFDFRLKPFVEFGLSACDLDPFHDNKYNLAIVYSRQIVDPLIGDASYWYGMDCQYDLFSPGIGFSYQLTSKWQILAKTQRLGIRLRYLKGLDIPGSPFLGYLLAQTYHEVWTQSLQANYSLGEHLSVGFGPWYKHRENLDSSWGVQIASTWLF
jgi:hypothetical protein